MISAITIIGSAVLSAMIFFGETHTAHYKTYAEEAIPYVMSVCPNGSRDHEYFEGGFTFKCEEALNGPR